VELTAYGGPFHGEKVEVWREEHRAVVTLFLDKELTGKTITARVLYTVHGERNGDLFLRYEDIVWENEIKPSETPNPSHYWDTDFERVKEQ